MTWPDLVDKTFANKGAVLVAAVFVVAVAWYFGPHFGRNSLLTSHPKQPTGPSVTVQPDDYGVSGQYDYVCILNGKVWGGEVVITAEPLGKDGMGVLANGRRTWEGSFDTRGNLVRHPLSEPIVWTTRDGWLRSGTVSWVFVIENLPVGTVQGFSRLTFVPESGGVTRMRGTFWHFSPAQANGSFELQRKAPGSILPA
jgi:hypothetical protein